MRIDFMEWAFGLAKATSLRATCTRAKVGAVLVSGNRLVSVGYNGAPPGYPHCLELGCLVVDNHCIRCRHAEINMLLFSRLTGKEKNLAVFLTHKPCIPCSHLMAAFGIQKVFFLNNYALHTEDQIKAVCGIEAVHVPNSSP